MSVKGSRNRVTDFKAWDKNWDKIFKKASQKEVKAFGRETKPRKTDTEASDNEKRE